MTEEICQVSLKEAINANYWLITLSWQHKMFMLIWLIGEQIFHKIIRISKVKQKVAAKCNWKNCLEISFLCTTMVLIMSCLLRNLSKYIFCLFISILKEWTWNQCKCRRLINFH
jgi:hypothetical protein